MLSELCRIREPFLTAALVPRNSGDLEHVSIKPRRKQRCSGPNERVCFIVSYVIMEETDCPHTPLSRRHLYS